MVTNCLFHPPQLIAPRGLWKIRVLLPLLHQLVWKCSCVPIIFSFTSWFSGREMARKTLAIIFIHWFAASFAVKKPLVEQPWVVLFSLTTWVSILRFGSSWSFPSAIMLFSPIHSTLNNSTASHSKTVFHSKCKWLQRAWRKCLIRHSGSPQRHRLGWACVLCSSQVRAAQVMWCLASANVVTYRLPATRLSGCKTGAPSQADVDYLGTSFMGLPLSCLSSNSSSLASSHLWNEWLPSWLLNIRVLVFCLCWKKGKP